MINTKHKDRLFCFLFGREENKRWTLSLYNAVNHSFHTDPDSIQITTMEEILYMGMKNDVSFIIMDIMSIYEQQATYNPNMPVRELMYACKPLGEYAWLIQRIREYSKHKDIEEAVDQAIDELPEDFEIRPFLVGHRAEVKSMCITEYNEEETMLLFKEQGREEGREEGIGIGEQNRANEMAERMIRAKEPGDKIVLYTGLGKEDVNKLAGSLNTILVWNTVVE